MTENVDFLVENDDCYFIKKQYFCTVISMYGNRYNFDKALKLFGAKSGYGAQMYSY